MAPQAKAAAAAPTAKTGAGVTMAIPPVEEELEEADPAIAEEVEVVVDSPPVDPTAPEPVVASLVAPLPQLVAESPMQVKPEATSMVIALPISSPLLKIGAAVVGVAAPVLNSEERDARREDWKEDCETPCEENAPLNEEMTGPEKWPLTQQ